MTSPILSPALTGASILSSISTSCITSCSFLLSRIQLKSSTPIQSTLSNVPRLTGILPNALPLIGSLYNLVLAKPYSNNLMVSEKRSFVLGAAKTTAIRSRPFFFLPFLINSTLQGLLNLSLSL